MCCCIDDCMVYEACNLKKCEKKVKNFFRKIWKLGKSDYLCAPVRLGRTVDWNIDKRQAAYLGINMIVYKEHESDFT
mgnify:CR=1 FL=1